jgi:hypothetical protein
MTRLFKDMFNGIEAFSNYVQKIVGFSINMSPFERSGGFCKDYEAFKRHFQRSGVFFFK